ncbi:hypothetical protein Pint_07209 [Pistacia integerrima]|uniref:Uncharacterized protein n=2 Tax=Pistacia TaxID=55512 RepID=A0ACC1AKC0_9ROSI|nr:hypothetical protein Pint_07209 [Pistacia integerrima]KAJ0087129.1 hypothetical protein Patl1_07299 [Pistacia atlantica]
MAQLLAWNGQANRKPNRTQLNDTEPMFHHLFAPTWITSPRCRARRIVLCCEMLINC